MGEPNTRTKMAAPAATPDPAIAQATPIAQQFLPHYYQLFDGADRSQLASLYTNDSTLTFEGEVHKGQQAIIQKLTNLTFRQCKHDLQTARLDVQVTASQGIKVLVTGQLQMDGGAATPFCEAFVLQQAGQSWYIHNHFFRTPTPSSAPASQDPAIAQATPIAQQFLPHYYQL